MVSVKARRPQRQWKSLPRDLPRGGKATAELFAGVRNTP